MSEVETKGKITVDPPVENAEQFLRDKNLSYVRYLGEYAGTRYYAAYKITLSRKRPHVYVFILVAKGKGGRYNFVDIRGIPLALIDRLAAYAIDVKERLIEAGIEFE